MPLSPADYRKTAYTHRRGISAARPAAADVLPGTLYFSTDTLQLDRSDGTTWQTYSGGGGSPGAAGPMGPIGFDGEQGEEGYAFPIPGPPGIQGVQGIQGLQGIGIPGFDGEDGLDGFSIPGPIGPSGPVGSAGPMGLQGLQGIPGLDAEEPLEPLMVPGPIGPQGPAGGGGGSITTLKTTGDQTINSGAGVFTNITGLTFPVVNGTDYAFYFYIVFRSAQTTTGWRASVNHPGGTVDHFSTIQTIANAAAGAATWLDKHNVVVDDMTLLTATVTANVDLICIIQGRYKCTANGTFAARFANELAANTDIVVQKGSWGFFF